jgi:aspartate/methionine/tyrosine aminotransferase
MKTAMRGNIRPFEVMEAFRQAALWEAEGNDVVHLSLGQPSSKPPQAVLDHVVSELQRSALGYTDACGLPALRERIAQYYQQRYGVTIPTQRVFITVGSSAAYFLSLLAAFDAGDKIAIARPCYPAYPNIMEALGITPLFIDADEQDGFQPNIAQLQAVGKVDGLLIASPSNPTGSILSPQQLQELTRYCNAHHIRMLSDEIYHHVTYEDAPFDTVARMDDKAIILNSFSKFFLLSGWRLGWAVIPEDLVRSYESLLQSFFISPSAIAQHAALKCFDHLDEMHTVVQGYARNRDMLKSTLEALGFTGLNNAQGAFYLYANITNFSHDSKQFCHDMLREANICAVPGVDFDQKRGSEYVRFSFCGDAKDIHTACEGLRKWLKQRQSLAS